MKYFFPFLTPLQFSFSHPTETSYEAPRNCILRRSRRERGDIGAPMGGLKYINMKTQSYEIWGNCKNEVTLLIFTILTGMQIVQIGVILKMRAIYSILQY